MSFLNVVSRTVTVRTQLEALHHWPDIPKGHPSQYLKYPHRHNFHIELKFAVSHNNRDLEFIEVKHQIDNFLQRNSERDLISGIIDFGSKSCEMLCEDLLEQFIHLGAVEASVFEDGELGSTVTINPHKSLYDDYE